MTVLSKAGKISALILLIAAVVSGLFFVFAQFNIDSVPEQMLTHTKDSGVSYFEWDDAGNKLALTPLFGESDFWDDLTGSPFLDAYRVPDSEEPIHELETWRRIGFSRVLDAPIEDAVLNVYLEGDKLYIVFLDDEILYTDFPDQTATPDTLTTPDTPDAPPAITADLYARHQGRPNKAMSIALPPDYAGRTLTIVECITSAQAFWWYPMIPSIATDEASQLTSVMIYGPQGIMTGISAAVLILLTVLFAQQLLIGKQPWVMLLPIFYGLIMMVGMSTFVSFTLGQTQPLRWINDLSNSFAFYCAGDLLLVFLSLKMKRPARFALTASAVAHFAVTVGFMIDLLARGESIFLEMEWLSVFGFAVFITAIALMVGERKGNRYFKFSVWGILAFFIGYTIIMLIYRFTNYNAFLEYFNPIEVVGILNFYPLNELLSYMMMLLVMVFSVLEYVSDMVDRRTRLISLEQINRLKTEFLGDMSHELKTPLAVMSGYAQHSQKSLADRPGMSEVEGHMKLIASEADRLALMVSQILDVTRIEEGRMILAPRPASLDRIIQNTVNTYCPVFAINNNKLRIEGCGDLPDVRCDIHRVTQVLVNLISNAAKHTRDGLITILAEVSGAFVAISVTDTGEGIAAARLPYLFDRYRSHDSENSGSNENKEKPREAGAAETGTGLGLYICKHIVEAHGGEITVKSAEGQGASLRFTLPIHA
ncbi:MAG: HAMP domain-containing histidine kinase [Oscillospiraceae bacterium]|nr:HAMP domain-containing histidine kinase [Oscillospiraceae bacterium]